MSLDDLVRLGFLDPGGWIAVDGWLFIQAALKGLQAQYGPQEGGVVLPDSRERFDFVLDAVEEVIRQTRRVN